MAPSDKNQNDCADLISPVCVGFLLKSCFLHLSGRFELNSGILLKIYIHEGALNGFEKYNFIRS